MHDLFNQTTESKQLPSHWNSVKLIVLRTISALQLNIKMVAVVENSSTWSVARNLEPALYWIHKSPTTKRRDDVQICFKRSDFDRAKIIRIWTRKKKIISICFERWRGVKATNPDKLFGWCYITVFTSVWWKHVFLQAWCKNRNMFFYKLDAKTGSKLGSREVLDQTKMGEWF
jgi:hypothetical protein